MAPREAGSLENSLKVTWRARVVHPRTRPGHHKLAGDPVRSTTAEIKAVAQREFRQIFPQPAGLSTTRWKSGRHRRAWPSRCSPGAGARARDVAAIGITNQRETTVVWDRKTGNPIHQRHRLAGSPHRGFCDRLRSRRHRAAVPRAHGPGARRLLFRHQARLDSRQRRRRARAGRSRRARVRHDRFVAALEADRRPPARHRRQQRLAHAAVQHPHAAVGRRAAAAVAVPRACCPRCAPRARSTARSRPRSVSSGVQLARHRRRSAGGALRADVHVARA